MSSQHLIDSTTLNIAHSAQALNPKENTKHALENLWSSKLTYDMESHLLNRLKTWFKASRHGGKFLHSLGSKSTLPSVVSDNPMCLAADHSQAEHSHTRFPVPRNTRRHSQSWGAFNSRVIPGSGRNFWRMTNLAKEMGLKKNRIFSLSKEDTNENRNFLMLPDDLVLRYQK